jgi:hypothetical protein
MKKDGVVTHRAFSYPRAAQQTYIIWELGSFASDKTHMSTTATLSIHNLGPPEVTAHARQIALSYHYGSDEHCHTYQRNLSMRPEAKSVSCDNSNYFSDVVAASVERRLPEKGSIASRILNHTTAVGPFFDTVSKDLCDDGRMGAESAQSALSFISRSATSAAVVGGTVGLVGLGVALGSPVAAVVAGAAGLAILPPLAERAVFGAANFAKELLAGVRRSE